MTRARLWWLRTRAVLRDVYRAARTAAVLAAVIVSGALAGAIAWALAHVAQSVLLGAALVALVTIRPHGSTLASVALAVALWRLWRAVREGRDG